MHSRKRNNVIIQVGDDGAGIDVAAVRDKAIERGIITEEQAESMSQKDIINILFCQVSLCQRRLPIFPDEVLDLM